MGSRRAVLSTGALYSCQAGTWAIIGGTGGPTSNPVSIAQGGTNATSAAAALTSLGAVPLAGGTISPGGVSIASLVFDCNNYSTNDGCLSAAETYATTNNTGSGHALRVYLHDGVWTPLSYPVTITAGVQLYGVAPRIVQSTVSGVNNTPNGGTWINCGGSPLCITGSGLRGFVMQDIGIYNFGTKAMSFGGNNTDGIANGLFDNVIGNGSSTLNTSGIFLRCITSRM